jgi:CRP-like cAMP-binding protein
MDSLIEKMLFLEKVDIFRTLSLEELSHIAEITTTEEFSENEILFRQGDPGASAFIVVSGSVELFLEDKAREPRSIMVLKDGMSFGEMALLDGQPRSASARVVMDSVLARIERDEFLRVLRSYPTLSLAIISHLSQRLRDANAKVSRQS